MNNIFVAFSLTLFAGLCTGIGSTIALLAKKTNTKFLSISLGFSAGVMIYVSLIEIFFKAKNSLSAELGFKTDSWLTNAAFFGGILLIALIDKAIPSTENPHEFNKFADASDKNSLCCFYYLYSICPFIFTGNFHTELLDH